jgi:TetR/AcrR family transcriptional repressor of nem operon
MIDMVADQIPGLPRKAARKQAASALATMMGTLVLARVAGSGDFSEEILAAGREAVLGGATTGGGKAVKKTAKVTDGETTRQTVKKAGASRH